MITGTDTRSRYRTQTKHRHLWVSKPAMPEWSLCSPNPSLVSPSPPSILHLRSGRIIFFHIQTSPFHTWMGKTLFSYHYVMWYVPDTNFPVSQHTNWGDHYWYSYNCIDFCHWWSSCPTGIKKKKKKKKQKCMSKNEKSSQFVSISITVWFFSFIFLNNIQNKKKK